MRPISRLTPAARHFVFRSRTCGSWRSACRGECPAVRRPACFRRPRFSARRIAHASSSSRFSGNSPRGRRPFVRCRSAASIRPSRLRAAALPGHTAAGARCRARNSPQPLQRGIRQLQGPRVAFVQLGQEMPGQSRHVLGVLAQGRRLDGHGKSVKQVFRKRPARTSFARSRLVAARTRTSTLMSFAAFIGRKRRVSRTRSSIACISGDSSPISSRNRAPPSACWKKPGWALSPPVKAPGSWPNNSAAAVLGLRRRN